MTKATGTGAPARVVRARRSTNVTLWVLQGLAVLVFAAAGFAKVTGAPESVELFHDMGLGDPGRHVIGILELVGAVVLLVPRLCGVAALAFTALMVGAIITQAILDPVAVVTPVLVLILVAVIAWGRRDRTVALVALVTRR